MKQGIREVCRRWLKDSGYTIFHCSSVAAISLEGVKTKLTSYPLPVIAVYICCWIIGTALVMGFLIERNQVHKLTSYSIASIVNDVGSNHINIYIVSLSCSHVIVCQAKLVIFNHYLSICVSRSKALSKH